MEGVQRVNRLSLRDLFPNLPGNTDEEVRKKLTEFFRKEQKKFNARAQERHKQNTPRVLYNPSKTS